MTNTQPIDPGEVRFFSGSSNRELAGKIAALIRLRLRDRFTQADPGSAGAQRSPGYSGRLNRLCFLLLKQSLGCCGLIGRSRRRGSPGEGWRRCKGLRGGRGQRCCCRGNRGCRWRKQDRTQPGAHRHPTAAKHQHQKQPKRKEDGKPTGRLLILHGQLLDRLLSRR